MTPVLRSTLDRSVNFVTPHGPGQMLEARYVRRTQEELIVYLSSQTACAMRCRFCHLTTTGQVNARDATNDEIVEQAMTVLDEYKRREDNDGRARVVNFNFMARGEPLDVRRNWPHLFDMLSTEAQFHGIPLSRFKISTIMPIGLPDGDRGLAHLFAPHAPDIYYSLYSTRREFLERWMPHAMDPTLALEMLVDWQRFSHKIPRIHLALIHTGRDGDPTHCNDSARDLNDLAMAVNSSGLRADFNLVRYNPPDDRTSEGNISLADGILRSYGFPVQVVERVGEDVFASCGMFVS